MHISIPEDRLKPLFDPRANGNFAMVAIDPRSRWWERRTMTMYVSESDMKDMTIDDVDSVLSHELEHGLRFSKHSLREHFGLWAEDDADVNGPLRTYGLDRTLSFLDHAWQLHPGYLDGQVKDHHRPFAEREEYDRKAAEKMAEGKHSDVTLTRRLPLIETVPLNSRRADAGKQNRGPMRRPGCP